MAQKFVAIKIGQALTFPLFSVTGPNALEMPFVSPQNSLRVSLRGGRMVANQFVVAGGVMKLLNLLLLGLLLAGATFAQSASTPSDPPGVTVTRFSWHKDIYVPALFDDPMSPNQDQADLKREQKAIKKANTARVAGGQTPLPMPTREIYSTQRDIPQGPSVNY